jgi:hypothetical protein
VSQRAGLFQAGLIAPLLADTSSRRALFISPVLKVGVHAISDGYALSYRTTTDETGATIRLRDADGRPVVNETSSLAPLWAVGVRIGYGELSCDQNAAPKEGKSTQCQRRLGRLVSYFDILYGSFANYRDIDESTGLTTSPKRLAFEGRLAIPELHFELGFDANLRASGWSAPPHDYRVFVAVQFDPAEAMKKAFGSSLPKE